LFRLKDEVTEEVLLYAKIVIIAGTNAPLGVNEVNILKNYLESGGSILVLAESCSASHYYNAFTQNYGISIVKGTGP
jgi:hypothetical protein